MVRATSRRVRSSRLLSAVATLIVTFAIAFAVSLFVALALALGSASVAQAVPPHGPYTTTGGDCAACHRVHTGKNRNLLKSATPQSNLCFTCHDGTGATTNVKAQYTDALVPPNNVANRLFYRHDTIGTTAHTRASFNEFGGTLNRHSECSDCHNAHKANALTNSTSTTTGWTASGRLAGISGVSVNLPAADTARTYTFLDGITTPITREYQLCYKCHSGFTTQLAPLSGKPSRDRLDKGREFNPNNLSYHPIEAPGKNTSAAMIGSLSEPSIYRRWTFTVGDTIRCSHCHVSSTTPTAALPGSNLSVHTSKNAGILRARYDNRILKPVGEAFNAAQFELCFMCHATGPFTAGGGSTNWAKHYGHTNTRTGTNVGGSDIDTVGGSGGNAICAECHFRIHSSTFKDPTKYTGTGRGMVNFAPNLGPLATWNGSGCGGFTCHGKRH